MGRERESNHPHPLCSFPPLAIVKQMYQDTNARAGVRVLEGEDGEEKKREKTEEELENILAKEHSAFLQVHSCLSICESKKKSN